MSDEKNAWLVCQGEYSDRFVRAAFLREEAARAWVGDRTYLGIEKVPLEPDALESPPPGCTGWYVQMWRDGIVRYAGEEPELEKARYCIHDTLDAGGSGLILIACVWARDNQHAIKIVNEKRAQIIASDQWVEGFTA